jgi:UPF0755 protein
MTFFSTKKFIALMLIFVFCALYTLYNVKIYNNTEKHVILFPQGTPLSSIANLLEDKGIISNRYIFIVIAKSQQWLRDAYIQSGEYEVLAGENMQQVIEKMTRGHRLTRRVVVPEGATIAEVKDVIRQAVGLSGEMDVSALQECNIMPDTYFYYYGESVGNIVSAMKQKQRQFLQELGLSYEGRQTQDLLTLASIVEKETALEHEKARVAGVYINRLRISMPLQADPTVVYAVSGGLGKLERPLSTGDLAIDNVYNTYKYKGLPPTPIACPGRGAITAALNPMQHNDLYFVADGHGGHTFAPDYKQHMKNVIAYRKALKESE